MSLWSLKQFSHNSLKSLEARAGIEPTYGDLQPSY
jgi:hypothetical protein